MTDRTYIKVARKAEYDGGYTTLTEVAGGVPSGEGGQGPKGEKGDTGPEGPPGKDGVVDPSKLNMVFNTDQIELVDADGNFCGLHVKGTNGITVTEDEMYGNQTMVIGLPEGYGGEGGKESKPFVDWHQFKVIERSSRFDYDPLFDTNPIAQTEWEYQIDLTGAGGFVKVEDIPEDIRLSIGWYSTPTVSHLRLNKTDDQMGTYPDARARFRVFTSLNGVDNEEFSCSLPAWADGECDYESSVSSLAARVEEGEDKQDEVIAAIQQIQVQGAQWALHVENIDEDQIIQNEQLDSLQYQVEELGVTKGKVARYTVTEINNVPSASRPGQLVVNSAAPSEVTLVSFGTEDLDNILTKPMADGDILEFVDAVDGTINRFTILDAAGAPTLVAVEYVSGDNNFYVNEDEQVYIYPQNSSSPTGVMTLDGVQLLKPGTWRVQQEDSITRGLSNYIVVQDDLLKLYHVQDPTGDEHAANKRYVDRATGNGMPPGLRFKFVEMINVQEGEFSYNEIEGKIKLRLSNISKDVTWNNNGLTKTVNYNEGHLFTIYNVDSNGKWRIIRSGTIDSVKWETAYAEFTTNSSHANGSMSTSYDYYITISGLI